MKPFVEVADGEGMRGEHFPAVWVRQPELATAWPEGGFILRHEPIHEATRPMGRFVCQRTAK